MSGSVRLPRCARAWSAVAAMVAMLASANGSVTYAKAAMHAGPPDPATSTVSDADAAPPARTTPPAADPVSADPDDDAPRARARRSAFDLPAAKRDDPYGPRPEGIASLTRDQIVRFALDNPAVAAASEEVVAMQAQLDKARFAWVPKIDTLTALSPGVNVRCDDLTLDDGTINGFQFQYCRSSENIAFDVNTVQGYFQQLSRAGVRVTFHADTVIPIFTFGKIKHSKALAQAGVAIKQLQKAAVEAETILYVYRAWAGLAAAREAQVILREAKKVIMRARERVEQDLGGGADDWDADPDAVNPDRDPDDIIKIELAELELEKRMREALKIESVALAALWALAGKAAPIGFDARADRFAADPVGGGGLGSVTDYKHIAQLERPEAKMAAAAIKARDAQQRLARSAFLPDFGIALAVDVGRSTAADPDMSQLYYQDGFNYSRFTAALALRWKLDLGLMFDLRKARAELRAAEHTREAARLLLGHEVEQAYFDVVDARHEIDLTAGETTASWKLVVSQEQRDTVGGGDAEKLLRALERWYRARFDHIQAIHQHNEALARLSRAVGMPLVAHASASAAATSRNASAAEPSP